MAKKNKKSKKIRTVIIVIAILAIIITVLVVFLRKYVAKNVATSNVEILTGTASKGSISTTVSGTGSLSNKTEEEVLVPEGVTLETVYVKVGDEVTEGQLIATVDYATLQTELDTINAAIEDLDEEIEDANSESESSTITSKVSGRVKKIYCEEGDSVSDVMYKKSALMLISLDGYMAVDIEGSSLAREDEVTVTASDGSTFDGTVYYVSDGVATIVVTDDGTVFDDDVKVSKDGSEVGSGKLYIHKQMKITGYTGTVSKVSVSENKEIKADTKLISLTDMENRGNVAQLIKERETYEERLTELLSVYHDGGIKAPINGVVESVTEDAEAGASFTTISGNDVMNVSVSVDESDILSISEGQAASVTVGSMSNVTFSGTVASIDKNATSSSGVTTYTATIEVEKTESMLAGMSASVVITIEGVEDAILIPVDALQKTRNSYYVYTEYNEETKELGGMTEVEVGITNGSYAEIKSGISENQTVYYEDTSKNSFGGFGNGSFPGGKGGSDGSSSFPGGSGSFPGGSGGFPGGSGGSGGSGNRPSGGSFPGGGN